jgi:hypothetical protein
MLYLSEYFAGLVYYRTNNSTRILHLVSIIVMLSVFLARNKILLKHVCTILRWDFKDVEYTPSHHRQKQSITSASALSAPPPLVVPSAA